MTKDAVRKKWLKKRGLLTTEEKKVATQKIRTTLLQLPAYKTARTVSCFVGMESEIDTTLLINQAMEDGKTVYLPRVESKTCMQMHLFTTWPELTKSHFGILEPPVFEPQIQANNLDLIIIPCITCTPDGQRLGYGGGYYDRYLEQLTRTAKIIINYDKLMITSLPTEPHDIVADIVITDTSLFYIKNT